MHAVPAASRPPPEVPCHGGGWYLAPRDSAQAGRVMFLPAGTRPVGYVALSRPRAAWLLAMAHAPFLAGVLVRGLWRAPAAVPRRLRAALSHVSGKPEVPDAAPLPPPARGFQPAVSLPVVSLIVPTTARGREVARCLRALLAGTAYPALELILVLAQPAPPDAAQRRLIARLGPGPVRAVWLPAARFHFAAACNHGAALARGTLLGLLNDDVVPRGPGWLAAMVDRLAEPGIGVIGARLLYPEGSVQHVGIAVAADGTCHHPHRFQPAWAPAARQAREVTAVTGACLLTSRDLWRRLGGLDPGFASAGNDVDFCLRARAAGARVVLEAAAELTHDESRSYRRHYAHAETARARADQLRLATLVKLAASAPITS